MRAGVDGNRGEADEAVGHPSREYLWILARRPEMQASLYHELLRRVALHGCDLTPIERTVQPAE